MYLNFDQLSSQQIYFHMIQSLLPRPVAWVLTQNKDQSYNLAPFSYFNAVSSEPPLLMISIGRKADGTPKDTLRNIQENKFFSVHIASIEQLAALNQTSASLAYGESELLDLNLKLCDFDQQPLPRLQDCRVAYACESYQIHNLGNAGQQIVYGRIKQCFFDDSIISVNDKGRIKLHAEKLNPVARLGASEYASLSEIIKLPRPV